MTWTIAGGSREIPQPARREVFFREFENIINTQETIRSADVIESSPERIQPELPLEIIRKQLQRARQQIAEERAQIDPPRVEETVPAREEDQEQRDVIQDVRRERRQNEKKHDSEVDTPASTPPIIIPPTSIDPIIDPIVDPIQESFDGPRLEISETPNNTENGPRLEIPDLPSEVSRARRIIHSPEEKVSLPTETPALDNENERSARVRIDSTETEQQDINPRLFIQDPVQR